MSSSLVDAHARWPDADRDRIRGREAVWIHPEVRDHGAVLRDVRRDRRGLRVPLVDRGLSLDGDDVATLVDVAQMYGHPRIRLHVPDLLRRGLAVHHDLAVAPQEPDRAALRLPVP